MLATGAEMSPWEVAAQCLRGVPKVMSQSGVLTYMHTLAQRAYNGDPKE